MKRCGTRSQSWRTCTLRRRPVSSIARFIAAVFDSFERLFGPLHAESYIHVHDVRAASYGYGGRTQEWRYHHPG